MVYFLNTNLNNKKKVYIALTKIYGLGFYQTSQICDELGISPEKIIKQLTQTEPALSAFETVITVSISLLKTPAAKPYLVLFARSITSLTLENLKIDITGPNI